MGQSWSRRGKASIVRYRLYDKTAFDIFSPQQQKIGKVSTSCRKVPTSDTITEIDITRIGFPGYKDRLLIVVTYFICSYKIYSMQKVRLLLVLVLGLSLVGMSCEKDKENGSASRTIKYEVSGNFRGFLVINYTTASGGSVNEEITTLPWNREITYASNVTAAGFGIGGSGGTAGQTISIVVKRGGSQVSSTPATANSAGAISASAPVVTF